MPTDDMPMDDRAATGGRSARTATATFELDVLLTTLPSAGGDVPLVFLDDLTRTPARGAAAAGLAEATALLAACLQTGLGLVTDPGDLVVPLAPGWQARLDGAGTLTVRSPRDEPSRPFCRVERLDVPPGWAGAASRLGYLVLFAGSLDISGGAAPAGPRLESAAAGGRLATGAISYRTG